MGWGGGVHLLAPSASCPLPPHSFFYSSNEKAIIYILQQTITLRPKLAHPLFFYDLWVRIFFFSFLNHRGKSSQKKNVIL